MLKLLLRWESPYNSQGRIDNVADKAEVILALLLSELPENMEFDFLASDAKMHGPYCLSGVGPIRVTVQDSLVNLQELRRSYPAAYNGTVPSLGEQASCASFFSSRTSLQRSLI